MATVANNDLVDGLSGRLGASLVFRTLRGKTFVTTPARKPDKRKESTPSEVRVFLSSKHRSGHNSHYSTRRRNHTIASAPKR